jgi:hypothetical protein
MNPTLPANFPQGLAAAAFLKGEETAWKKEDCLATINWLSHNSYAILGFELWLIRDDGISTAISTKSGPATYVYNRDPTRGENCEAYVLRSAKEAADCIAAFGWPEVSLEPPRAAYFNLTWEDREWFRGSEGKCRTYF